MIDVSLSVSHTGSSHASPFSVRLSMVSLVAQKTLEEYGYLKDPPKCRYFYLLIYELLIIVRNISYGKVLFDGQSSDQLMQSDPKHLKSTLILCE